MMKKILWIIAITPFATLAQTNPFVLNGKVHDSKISINGMIYLSFKQHHKEIIDSAKLVNGTYSFKGFISYPAQAVLKLKVADSIEKYHQQTRILKEYTHEFYIDKGMMTASAAKKLNSTIVKGSAADDDRQALIALCDPYNKTNKVLYDTEGKKAYQNKDSLGIARFVKKRDILLQKVDSVKKAYLFGHPKTGIALKMLSEYTLRTLEPTEIEPLFKQIQPELKASPEGIAYAQRIEKARSTGIGIIAPEFKLKDRNGKEISLSSLKGKLVLLDFWGSWCFPCRQTHPHLRELYAKYKNQGFEIFGVANELGTPEVNYKKWTAALDEDKMNWTNVLAVKAEKDKPSVPMQYSVNAYPTKILIDKNGAIVKKFVGAGTTTAEELDQLIEKLILN